MVSAGVEPVADATVLGTGCASMLAPPAAADSAISILRVADERHSYNSLGQAQ
jgi:hypothetical protein